MSKLIPGLFSFIYLLNIRESLAGILLIYFLMNSLSVLPLTAMTCNCKLFVTILLKRESLTSFSFVDHFSITVNADLIVFLSASDMSLSDNIAPVRVSLSLSSIYALVPLFSSSVIFCNCFSCFLVRYLNFILSFLIGVSNSNHPFSSPISLNSLGFRVVKSTVVSICSPVSGSRTTIGNSGP